MLVQNVQEVISLEPVRVEDAIEIYALIEKNYQYLAPWLPWVANLNSIAQEEAFLEYAANKIAKGQLYLTNIVIDGQIIGQIDIHNISQNNHRGEVGYWLDREFQGHGIMTYALRHIMEYAFAELHLHRLELYTDVANESSQQVARRLSWKKEACLRDYLISGSEYRDAVLFCKINHQN